MKSGKKVIASGGIALIAVALLVLLDQLTKQWAVQNLMGKPDIILIKDVLVFQYLENTGAAFGLFKNQGWLFIVFSLMFLLFGAYLFKIMPKTKRYLPLHIIIVVLLAGAIGNLIDRVMYAYVIDFIYFVPIDFPVFNVADMYVTISTGFLILLIILFYKDEDFAFMDKKNVEQIETDEQGNELS